MLTWTCQVCGLERPDNIIAVMRRDISNDFFLPPGTITENVRYCSDSPECEKGAERVRFLKPPEK